MCQAPYQILKTEKKKMKVIIIWIYNPALLEDLCGKPEVYTRGGYSLDKEYYHNRELKVI